MPRARPIPAFVMAYSESDFTNPHETVQFRSPPDCRKQFTHMGVKYWGYESSRHRATRRSGKGFLFDDNAAHWMEIGLKKRARIREVWVSTRWHTGNHVPAVTLHLKDTVTGKKTTVLLRKPLRPDREHKFRIRPTVATEARAEFHSEGGLTRILFLGTTEVVQSPTPKNLLEEAKITHVSDIHYGKPQMAVRGNRREMHMVGWESSRSGFGERALFHLRRPARLREIVIDTYLHRLNPPLAACVYGIRAEKGKVTKLMRKAPGWKVVFAGGRTVVPKDLQSYMLGRRYLKEKGVRNRTRFRILACLPAGCPWKPVLPFAPLRADTYHRLRSLQARGPFTHLLYMHFPNGGVHGLKVFGDETAAG
jgi:allantoicase